VTGGEAVRPAAMEGQGQYNRSSQVQAAGLSPAVPMLVRAAREVSLPDGRLPIVIADYGSSQGHNSLAPVAAAIDVLRERVGPERAISVAHIDLPENDFTALFATLRDDPQSYLQHDKAVFASAVGRSFYEQVLPAETVTLGWSSWAVQWLSHAPAVIPDQVQVAQSADAAVKEAFHKQAAEDWQAFLMARGRELCKGAGGTDNGRRRPGRVRLSGSPACDVRVADPDGAERFHTGERAAADGYSDGR
jgi:hypothetical protein